MQNHSEVQFKLKRFRIMCLTFVIFSSKAEPNQTLSRNPLTPSQSLAFLFLQRETLNSLSTSKRASVVEKLLLRNSSWTTTSRYFVSSQSVKIFLTSCTTTWLMTQLRLESPIALTMVAIHSLYFWEGRSFQIPGTLISPVRSLLVTTTWPATKSTQAVRSTLLVAATRSLELTSSPRISTWTGTATTSKSAALNNQSCTSKLQSSSHPITELEMK